MAAGKLIFGAAVATGALLLIPGVAPTVVRATRPFMKSAMKHGLKALDEFRQAAAETVETLEDVLAEVKAEHAPAEAEAAAEAAEAAGETVS